MFVPEHLLRLSCFLGTETDDGKISFRGSGILLKHENLESAKLTAFVITAKHVVDKIFDHGCQWVVCQVNAGCDSSTLIRLPKESWRYHPNSGQVDVAVCPVQWDHTKIRDTGYLLNEQEMVLHRFGLGEEILVIGLFSHLANRAIAVARVGNLAALRTTKIPTNLFGPIDAYLIELHSIGGLSGSPVFARIQYSIPESQERIENPEKLDDPYFMMIGIIHGHFDVDEDLQEPAKHSSKVNVNTGMAAVIPSNLIRETLDHAIGNRRPL